MPDRENNQNERGRSGFPGAPLAGAVVVFVLFHVAASLFFPERVWSAHHLRFLPPPWIAVWAAVLAIVLAPPLRRRAADAADALLDRAGRLGRPGSFLLFTATVLFLYLFRTQNLFLGDGWLLTSVVRNPEETGLGSAGYLSLAIHRGVLAALRVVRPGAGGAAPFRVTACLAGGAAVWIARALAAELGRTPRARRLLFATLLLSGGSLLFFGYVEYYPPMQAALLLYLWLGVRRLRGRGGLILPTAALGLAAVFHVSAVVFAPTWIVLALRGKAPGRRARPLLAVAAAAAAAGGWALLHFTERAYRGWEAFLPLGGAGDQSYGFFSVAHAVDAANLLFLILGGALLLPLLRWGAEARSGVPDDQAVEGNDGEEGDRTDGGGDRAAALFLAVAAAFGLAAFLFFDPKLGSRDWDLMALPLFPFLLFLARPLFFGRVEPRKDAAALLVGAMILHTFPWVAAQLDRDRAVRMTLAMVAEDPHYDNPAARAPKSFGVLLARRGYDREAGLLFERAAEKKEDPQNLFNLGTNRARRGDLLGAVGPLEEAIRLDPGYREAYVNLATVRVRLNEPARAESTLRALIAASPDYGKGYRLLGTLLVDEGRVPDGLDALREAVRLDPRDGDGWTRIGIVLAGLGGREEAKSALGRALEIDPANERARNVLNALEKRDDPERGAASSGGDGR
ncbi:MAG: tetratricopeptide repeat protein [Candidatus Eisenbacteria bacterium]|nr:tetratricopeptide repeat protein [Candidatus Eisenbacteria bacterium]